MTLNDEFSLKELTEQQEDIKEQDLKFSANFKLPFKNGNKLKFGAKVVRKTKDKEVDFYEYSPLDEDAFMTNKPGKYSGPRPTRTSCPKQQIPGRYLRQQRNTPAL